MIVSPEEGNLRPALSLHHQQWPLLSYPQQQQQQKAIVPYMGAEKRYKNVKMNEIRLFCTHYNFLIKDCAKFVHAVSSEILKFDFDKIVSQSRTEDMQL